MENAFDQKVMALSKTSLTKIIRPIRFIDKCEIEKHGYKFKVGNVIYVLQPDESIPIMFMGAFQVNDWIICLEKSMIGDSGPMICGFYKGEQHCNFGPIDSDADILTEFFTFFDGKILQ